MPTQNYRFQLLDVFTDVAFGGNQLAVFPEAQGLSDEEMQAIARELNLSECAFAFAHEGKPLDWTLRIFTPGLENPFAGHPTIGSAIALSGSLRRNGAPQVEVTLHEQIGPISVSVESDGQLASAILTLPTIPQFGPADCPTADLAAMLGIEVDDILEGEWAPATLTCGIPYYVVPVASLEAAQRCSLQLDRWESTLSRHWAPHVYVVARDTERNDADFHVRMFPPAMRVSEDPATGSAAAVLSGLLARIDGGSGPRHWSIEQGHELGRPSLIQLFADLDEGVVQKVSVGGKAVRVGDGEIRIAR